MAYIKWTFISFLFLIFSFDGLGQDMKDTLIARQYLDSLEVLKKSFHYDEALAYGVKALNIYQRELGEQDTLTARAYFLIAEVLVWKNIERKEVAEYYQKALDIQIKILGEENVTVANTYEWLAVVCPTTASMLKYRKLALDIYKKVLKEDDPRLLRAYSLTGLGYLFEKEYDKALEHFFEVLAIGLKTFGEHHKDVSRNYHSIGYVYECKEEFDKAIEYYQKQKEAELTNLEDRYGQMRNYYGDLARVYKKMLDYDKAIEYMQEALKIKREMYGEESISVNGTYSYSRY